MVRRLLVVLEERRNEATADDLSRMAWLALYTNQSLKAEEFVSAGLQLDPNNMHCSRLRAQFDDPTEKRTAWPSQLQRCLSISILMRYPLARLMQPSNFTKN